MSLHVRNSIACVRFAIAGCLALFASAAQAQYIDTATGCLLCHRTALPQNDFCKLVPAEIWERSDKHNRAFALLHDTEAKRELVRRILGFEMRDAFVDDRYSRLSNDPAPENVRKVAAVKACLRCHATWPKEADERYPHTPPVTLDLGVSCQACHGPGQLWETPHRLPAWRLVTPAAKAALGCTDVRTTTEKARLCASCHVGDLAQERFVKHEWYAAGHPPLPGFELAAFETQMPAHWQSLREKGAFMLRDSRPAYDGDKLANDIAALERFGVPLAEIKASYREAHNLSAAESGHDSCNDLPRSRDAIVAGAVVLESYVRMLGDYAASAAESKAAWPELALYDCSACHHELRSGLGLKDRPVRRHPPGRPPLATWPLALAQLSAAQAAGHDEKAFISRWTSIRVQIADLEQALTSRPFGDAARVRNAAEPLATSLVQLAKQASGTPFDRPAAARSLAFLSDPANYETHDYASARQAAWAIRSIAADLEIANANQLFSANGEDWLTLQLPSGPNKSVMENLRRWLPAAAGYDPERFRRELRTIQPSP